MSLVTDSTLYWAVLARSRGEVLAAETESGGVHLGMFGVPGGLTRQETQAWLGEVIGVACESAASGSPGPIPALLHHAMTGLIFTHAELWDRVGGGKSACSYVFAQAGDRVGFGWIGDADVAIWVDGEPCDAAWITVRDESGAEGRAWCIGSDHTVQVRLVWNAPGDDALNGGEAEAVWTAATFSSAPAMPAAPIPALFDPEEFMDDIAETESPVDVAVDTSQIVERIAEMESPADVAVETGEVVGLAAGDGALPAEGEAVLPPQSEAIADAVGSALPFNGGEEAIAEEASASPETAEHETEAPPSSEAPSRQGVGGWVRKGLAWLGGLGKARQVQPAEQPESGVTEVVEVPAESYEAEQSAEIASDEPLAADAPAGESVVAETADEELIGAEAATVESSSEMAVEDMPVHDEVNAVELAAVTDLIPPTPEPTAVTQQAVPLTSPAPLAQSTPVAADEHARGSGKKKGRGEKAPEPAPAIAPAIPTAPIAHAPTPPVATPAPAAVSPAPPAALPAATVPQSERTAPPAPTVSAAPPVAPSAPTASPAPATPAMASVSNTPPVSAAPVAPPAPVAAPPAPIAAPPAPVAAPPAPIAAQPAPAAPAAPAAPPVSAVSAAPQVPGPPAPRSAAATRPSSAPTPVTPQVSQSAPAPTSQTPRVLPPPQAAAKVTLPETSMRSYPEAADSLDDPAIADPPAEVAKPQTSSGVPPQAPSYQLAIAPDEEEEFDFDAAIADIVPMIPQDPAIADAPAAEIASEPAPAPAAAVVAPVLPAEPSPATEKRGPRESARGARPRHPSWPSRRELQSASRPAWRRPWVLVAGVMVLFIGGWLLGAVHETGKRATDGSGAFGGALQAIGLGGPRFTVNANSTPPGAWISVDGKALTMRTPATLSLTPGEHTVRFSFADLGGADFTVRGLKGDRMPLDATLWGALDVFSPNEVGVISVMVDGEARGMAPMRVDSLSPGVHEVRFSAPGTAPWGQTVDVHVGETRELLARANPSPAKGLLQVQASITDEQGTQPIKGGQVYIDGDLRGVAPLTLELPRGPHSVRFLYKDIQAPIQVIDLPGGNQRFAVFELGLDREWPRLVMEPPRIARDRPSVVSVSLSGILPGEISGMWLHTQTASGAWRKYDMTLIKAAGGVVGVAVFPISAFDGHGVARYYASAGFVAGDEAYTEIRTLQLDKTTTDH